HRPRRTGVEQHHLAARATPHALASPRVDVAVAGGALSIRNVGKVYGADHAAVVALDDVSPEIASGELCVLVGPSGRGQAALLNCLAGFETVTSGEIALDGQLLAAPGRKLLPGADRMVVFQAGALFPWKTVLWNVTCGPMLSGRLTKDEAEARARAFLSRVG